MSSRRRILEAAMQAVTVDRAATHGPVERNFDRLAAVWSLRLGVPLTPAQVALMLIDLKIVRAWNNPEHLDNWIDIAGYSACGGEVSGCPAAPARPRGPEPLPGPDPEPAPRPPGPGDLDHQAALLRALKFRAGAADAAETS